MDRRRKKVIYLRIDEDVLKEIEKRRATAFGTVSRSDFINQLLREALQMEVKA